MWLTYLREHQGVGEGLVFHIHYPVRKDVCAQDAGLFWAIVAGKRCLASDFS